MLIRNGYGETLNPLTELTTRLREAQFLIPNIAVEDLARPIAGRYPGKNEAVQLCVEILSPPDRIGKLFAKCEDFHNWGVPYCWVIDPERKAAWEYFPSDVEPRKVADVLTAGIVRLALTDVFFRV